MRWEWRIRCGYDDLGVSDGTPAFDLNPKDVRGIGSGHQLLERSGVTGSGSGVVCSDMCNDDHACSIDLQSDVCHGDE